ncbi:MAG: hypothetical protein ACRDJE_03205 [Dehalococcoidia bacterium]
MIIATRIPGCTQQMRRATIQAAEARSRAVHDQYLIDDLQRRGYRVTRPERLA